MLRMSESASSHVVGTRKPLHARFAGSLVPIDEDRVRHRRAEARLADAGGTYNRNTNRLVLFLMLDFAHPRGELRGRRELVDASVLGI